LAFASPFVLLLGSALLSSFADLDTLSPRQMAFLTISVFALTGTPINGALITASKGSYVGATVFSGVVVLLGSGFLTWAWWVTSRKKGTRWV